MKTKLDFQLLSTVIFVWIPSRMLISCNPITYEPTLAAMMPIPPMPIAAPMLIGPHFDPFGQMQASPFMMGSPFGPMPLHSNRRSFPGFFKLGNKNSDEPSNDSEENDEKKALEGLPSSSTEPDPPSSMKERISDSFSALGEGVRNHFRSLTENFSDTMDDLKDAWRPSEDSKRRSYGA